MNHAKRKKYLVYFIFFLISSTSLVLSIKYRGTLSQVNSICNSIRDAGLNGKELCSGAVDAIGWTPSFTLEKVHNSFPLYFWYFPLFLLALLPFFYFKVFANPKNIAVMIFLFLLPLYFIVNDYGRWFSMFYTSYIFVLIAPGSMPASFPKHKVTSHIGIPYLTTWGIPHFADPNLAFPIVGAIATTIRLLLKFINVDS